MLFRGEDLTAYDEAFFNETTVHASYSSPEGFTYTGATCTVVELGETIECEAVPGIGRNLEWVLHVETPLGSYDVAAVDHFTSYAAPSITSVDLVPAADGELDNQGGSVVQIRGAGYGPADEEPSRVQAQYRVGDVWLPCNASIVVSDSTVNCTVGEGVGQDVSFRVVSGAPPVLLGAGGSSLASEAFPTAYDFGPPVILSVSGGPLQTTGGDRFSVRGIGFGAAADDISIVYGPGEDLRYSATDCVLVAQNELSCVAAAGVGADLNFQAGVGDVRSDPYHGVGVRYEAPLIGSPEIRSNAIGTGDQLRTKGGSTFSIFGTNFGPKSDEQFVTVRYGRAENETAVWYRATDCVVKTDQVLLLCSAAEGSGEGFAVQVEVAGQVSNVYAGNMSYAHPYVTNYDGSWTGDGASTTGEDRVTIAGENFGPGGDAFAIDSVRYYVASDQTGAASTDDGDDAEVESAYEFALCTSRARCAQVCALEQEHEELVCNMLPGAGADLQFEVVVDGLETQTSYTKYGAPVVSAIAGGSSMPVRGSFRGEKLTIEGANFGPPTVSGGGASPYVQSVSYGPSGSEYDITELCSHESHRKLVCGVPPGIGSDMLVLVEVGNQRSPFSPELVSYATPVVSDITPSEASTFGLSQHVLSGTHLALRQRNFEKRVLFMGRELCRSPCTNATACAEENCGLLSDRLLCPCGINVLTGEKVTFRVPEMVGSDHAREVHVQITSMDHPHISTTTEGVHFEYAAPALSPAIEMREWDSARNADHFGDASPFADNAQLFELRLVGDSFSRSADFGDSQYPGDVLVDGAAVPATHILEWTHRSIRLLVSASRGVAKVRVGQKESNEEPFDQRSPMLIANEPGYGPLSAYPTSALSPSEDSEGSEGSAHRLRLLGQNFGTEEASLRVTYGTYDCAIVEGSLARVPFSTLVNASNIARYSEFADVADPFDEVACDLSPGAGRDHELFLIRANSRSFVDGGQMHIHYLPPSTIALDPQQTPTTGAYVRILGDNLGGDPSDVDIRIGGQFTGLGGLLNADHTSLTALVLPGAGAGDLTLSVGGQAQSTPALNFTYRPPQIFNVTPGEIPMLGADVNVTGADFGPPGVLECFLLPVDATCQVLYTDPVDHAFATLRIGRGQGSNELVLNVGGQTVQSNLRYEAPEIDRVEPREVRTSGGETITVFGRNFGLDLDNRPSVALTDGLFEDEGGSVVSTFVIDRDEILEVSPERLVFRMPPGFASQNATVSVRNCALDLIPSTCVRGTMERVMRFKQAALTVTTDYTFGVEPAPFEHTEVDIFGNGTFVQFAPRCSRTGRAVDLSLGILTPPGGQQAPVDTSSPQCGLGTSGGDLIAIYGSNLGVPHGQRRIRFGEAVLSEVCIVELLGNRATEGFAVQRLSQGTVHESALCGDRRRKLVGSAVGGQASDFERFGADYRVLVRTPAGIGVDVPIVLERGPQDATDAIRFSYDPPFVVSVEPAFPNAAGDKIKFFGRNFGPSRQLSEPASILIGGVPCEPIVGIGIADSVWQQDENGIPFLWCQTGGTRVGPQRIEIAAAGQTANFTREDRRIYSQCTRGYYGQGSFTPYPDFPCVPCSDEQVACMDTFSVEEHGEQGWPDNDACRRSWPCVERATYGLEQTTELCSAVTHLDEYCLECPLGTECVAPGDALGAVEPTALFGYYVNSRARDEGYCEEEREHRPFCYEVSACMPPESCTGANECKVGYTGARCAQCCDVRHQWLIDERGDFIMDAEGRRVLDPNCHSETDRSLRFDLRVAAGERYKYFRMNGECQPCPDNLVLLICLSVLSAIIVGCVGYFLLRRNVELGVLSIGVDFFQVLAIFAAARVDWPYDIEVMLNWLSIFNFNLNLTAPECLFEVQFETKWIGFMSIPLIIFGMCTILHYTLYWRKRLVRKKKHENLPMHVFRRKWMSHFPRLLGFGLISFYYIYLFICMTALSVFNCAEIQSEDGLSISDGKEYLVMAPEIECHVKGGTQQRLLPWGVVTFAVYSVGYLVLVAWILLKKGHAKKAKIDQLERTLNPYDDDEEDAFEEQHENKRRGSIEGHAASQERRRALGIYKFRKKYGRLYYQFKPMVWYWMILMISRKFGIACIALLFRANAIFQLCMMLLVMFVAFSLHIRYQPYLSPAERDIVLFQAWKSREFRTYLLALEKAHMAADEAYRNKFQRNIRASFVRGQMLARDQMDRMALDKNLKNWLINWNLLETVLLGIAVLVCLIGVLFLSEHLDRGSGGYQFLTIFTILIILIGVLYYVLVVWEEIAVVLFPKLAILAKCNCVWDFQVGFRAAEVGVLQSDMAKNAGASDFGHQPPHGDEDGAESKNDRKMPPGAAPAPAAPAAAGPAPPSADSGDPLLGAKPGREVPVGPPAPPAPSDAGPGEWDRVIGPPPPPGLSDEAIAPTGEWGPPLPPRLDGEGAGRPKSNFGKAVSPRVAHPEKLL